MCTVLLPPGDNPIAVNKYIINLTQWQKAVSARSTKISEQETV
jgi:hypothetical protein